MKESGSKRTISDKKTNALKIIRNDVLVQWNDKITQRETKMM